MIDVQAKVLAAEAVQDVQHTGFLRILDRCVEIVVAPPLPERRIVRHEIAGLEHLAELVVRLRVRVVGDLVGLEHAISVGVAGKVAAREHVVRVGQIPRDRPWQVALPVLVADREVTLPFRQARATLGEDLHDAIGGVRPVQGAGRRALDDFHALDVFRRDVRHGESRDRAVDDDERIGLAGDARR